MPSHRWEKIASGACSGGWPECSNATLLYDRGVQILFKASATYCPSTETLGPKVQGSVIQVMLRSRFRGMVGQKHLPRQRMPAQRYGRERCVPSLWIPAIQEKWPYSYREAEPSMSGVWPPICLARRPPRYWRRTTHLGRTLTPRENLPARHLSHSTGFRGGACQALTENLRT
jgi:hypothetical protein